VSETNARAIFAIFAGQTAAKAGRAVAQRVDELRFANRSDKFVA